MVNTRIGGDDALNVNFAYSRMNTNRTKVIHYAYAFLGFVYLRPYFTWDTYLGGIFSRMGLFLIALNALLFVAFFFSKRKLSVANLNVSLVLLSITLYQRLTGLGTYSNFNSIIGHTAIILVIALFLLFNDEDKKRVYYIFTWFFAISLISGITVWLLTFFGIDLPYNVLQPTHPGKAASGAFYLQYPGSVILIKSYIGLNRLCGMFDEPGVVGTIGALLLAGDNLRLKGKWQNIIILIAGILSFSLAFYVLVFLTITIKYLNKGMIKFVISMMVVIVLLFLVLNIETDNPLIKRYIQNRIFTDEGFIISNRTNDTFDYAFNSFLKDDTKYVLFGYGNGMAINNRYIAGSYSYKMLIYDFGVIGFSFIVGWLIFASLRLNKGNRDCLLLLIVFLVSIYQRPYVITIPFIIVLFGGYANLKVKGY